jgi:hypothetical protein
MSTAVDATTTKYFNEVSRHKLPSLKEERELFTAYKAAQTRSELGSTHKERVEASQEKAAIGQKIACGYLRFVILQARRKTNDPQLLKDLISQGNVGLMIGVERFDLGHKVRFLTYAASWINVCMQEYLHKLGTVHVPSHTRKEMRRRRVQNVAKETTGSVKDFTFEEPNMTPIDGVTITAEDDTETQACSRECNMFDYMEQAALSRAEKLVLAYSYGLRGVEMKSDEIAQFLYELDGSLFQPEALDEMREIAIQKVRSLMAAKGIAAIRDVL